MADGPILFSEIQFVHHSYGKRKAEDCALQMEKLKKFRACPANFSKVMEDSIRQLCTSLEANGNACLFTTIMRNNDCQPLPSPACASTSAETDKCTTWINFLYHTLKQLPIWPSSKVVQETMPACFKEHYPNTRVILDCTEIFIQMPSSFRAQSQTYSSYKSHNTAKGLIGIAPKWIRFLYFRYLRGSCIR